MRSFSYVIGITIFSICFFSCVSSGLDEAKQVADLASETSGRHSPGSIPTSDSHYYMKAKIDGKQWIASHMLPDQDENSSYIIIHGENGEDYMDFQLWKRGIDPGKKILFDSDHVANLSLKNDPAFWSGKKGEIEITWLDGQWMEGKFSYKATSSSSAKMIDVTEGFFRVPFTENPSP